MLPEIGDTVTVVSITDETGDKDYLGESGKVINLDYSCGCGQSEGDPMIEVLFDDGETEEFWKEELGLDD